MNRKLTYKCSKDTGKMPVSDLGFYCQSCSKNIFDFTHKTDEEVTQILKKADNNICIHIQNKRLHLVSSKVWGWKFLLVILINAKILFLSKLYGKSQTISTISTKSNTIKRVIKGRIIDSVTRAIVRNPLIEVVKNGETILLKKGDINGNFEFVIENSPYEGDTISLRINSWGYTGKIIENFPIKKITTTLNTSIPKKGEIPYFKNEFDESQRYDVWTGKACVVGPRFDTIKLKTK